MRFTLLTIFAAFCYYASEKLVDIQFPEAYAGEHGYSVVEVERLNDLAGKADLKPFKPGNEAERMEMIRQVYEAEND